MNQTLVPKTPVPTTLVPKLLKHDKAINCIKQHKHILLAVSGGSDSIAMMMILKDTSAEDTDTKISVATVNHGLRKEAQQEAEMVKQLCKKIKLNHKTLIPATLENNNAINNADDTSVRDARETRYKLLAQYAQTINASAIITAHTQNDQVETTIMRAQRIKEKSHTAGLAAMAHQTTYQNIKIIRPLLNTTRQELKNFLKKENIKWCSDPTNHNTKFERTRIRNSLRKQQNANNKNIARFAQVCGNSRLWLNKQTVILLPKYVIANGNELVFTPPDNLPKFAIIEVLVVMIKLVSGLAHRTPHEKLKDSVEAIINNKQSTKTAGHTIIKVKNKTAKITKETKDTRAKMPETLVPNLGGFTHFRPCYDDCIYEWAQTTLMP